MDSGYHEKEILKTADRSGKQRPFRLIVLIPHRDTGRVLEEYRRNLFSKGVESAYSLPAVVPLAGVSRPFTGEELKACAVAVRALSLQNGGKISTMGPGAGDLRLGIRDWGSGTGDQGLGTGSSGFFGLLLDLPWDDSVFAGNQKVLSRFPKPLLFACLLEEGETVQTEGNPRFPRVPELSFRAAMIANLSIHPLETGAVRPNQSSFKWELSAPVWLPRVKAN